MFSAFMIVLLFGGAIAAFVYASRQPTGEPGDGIHPRVLLRIVGAVLAVVAFAVTVFSTLNTVDAGTVGIPVTFGHVGSDLQPGIHFVAPWTDINAISVRTDTLTMDHHASEGQVAGDDSIGVKSADGATVDTDVSIQYHIDPLAANGLFKTVGTDYITKIVRPESRSALQDTSIAYNAVELYSTKREAYQKAAFDELGPRLAARGIILESILIRDMRLPANISAAIQDKLASQQNAQAQQYKLQTAQQQAQIAIVAARGQATANEVLGKSLRENPGVICQHFVDAIADGKVTAPILVNVCGGSSAGANALIQVGGSTK